ncbi:MAG: transglycosylase SLT domain-containing protein [Desulfarculus sp.]|nr:transglycosylase SLT domain-containing protein [Desulfarculus sp.]
MAPARACLLLALVLAWSLPLGSCVADQSAGQPAPRQAVAAPAAPAAPVAPASPATAGPGGDYCAPRYLPQMPKELFLAGERVPLENPLVAESLDREFTIAVHDQAQVVMWMKRAQRYFPHISARLKSVGLPDDLKYLAVAESSLLHRVVSVAGATGPWQFMEATGRAYGLRRDAYFDDRRNPEKATEAALGLLRDLHKSLGSWSLAMAAYNCGERRVRQEMAEQGVRSYYDLYLPYETMRYVFRIMAAKLILENPSAYGYCLPGDALYQPLPADRVRLNLAGNLHLRSLGQATGTTVRMLKELNPELMTYMVPKGVHDLKVPQGQGAGLAQRLSATRLEPAPVAAPAAPAAAGRAPAEDAPPPALGPREDSATPAPQAAQPLAPPEAVTPAVKVSQAAPAPSGAQAPQTAPEPPAASMPQAATAPPAAPVPQAEPPLPSASPEAKKSLVAKGQAKREWTVKGGESLSGIARSLGVSVAALKQANGLKGDAIKPGQKLLVPLK